jgi:hypothetical protein
VSEDEATRLAREGAQRALARFLKFRDELLAAVEVGDSERVLRIATEGLSEVTADLAAVRKVIDTERKPGGD